MLSSAGGGGSGRGGLAAGGSGHRGGLGAGGGSGAGGGRGHFGPAAIYCITTWCFALKGLRTTTSQKNSRVLSHFEPGYKEKKTPPHENMKTSGAEQQSSEVRASSVAIALWINICTEAILFPFGAVCPVHTQNRNPPEGLSVDCFVFLSNLFSVTALVFKASLAPLEFTHAPLSSAHSHRHTETRRTLSLTHKCALASLV